MLSSKELEDMKKYVSDGQTSRIQLRDLAENIRANLNPHPGGQKETNVPVMDGGPVRGMQHKYRETVLFFPTEVRISF
jgi:L-lysine 2,3-aminomutase